MPWVSCITNDICHDENSGFVHIFNENTSWHGHAIMSIEYSGSTFWGLSYQPEKEDDPILRKILLGVRASLRNRTTLHQREPGISGKISQRVLTFQVEKDKLKALEDRLNLEFRNILNRGVGNKIGYASAGPCLSWFKLANYNNLDNCCSWIIRILIETKIMHPAWGMIRNFFAAPRLLEMAGKKMPISNYRVHCPGVSPPKGVEHLV